MRVNSNGRHDTSHSGTANGLEHRLASWAIQEGKRFLWMFLYLWVLFGLFVLNERIILSQKRHWLRLAWVRPHQCSCSRKSHAHD
jgi:hypothetical protein